jgi:hypothetical protein
MRKLATTLLLAALPAFAAAPPQAPPAKAVPPPQAPAPRETTAKPPQAPPAREGFLLDGKPLTVPVRVEDYDVKRAEAVRRNLPLVVFVGQQPYHSDYWPPHLMAYAQTLAGAQAPCVVIGVPRDGDLDREADLPGKPDLVQIGRVLDRKRAVQGYLPADGGSDFWEPAHQGVPERGGPFRGGGGFRFFGGGRRGGGC